LLITSTVLNSHLVFKRGFSSSASYNTLLFTKQLIPAYSFLIPISLSSFDIHPSIIMPKWELPVHGGGSERPHEKGNTWKYHFVAMTGEFVGTFLFLYYAYAGHLMIANQASDRGPNNAASAQTVIYISLAYGMSLLVVVWAFYRISGGLFNPAVSWTASGYNTFKT